MCHPGIASSIGVEASQSDRDAVADYIASPEAISVWDAWEVRQSHEYRFRGLAEGADNTETVTSSAA